jgi:hypothetical protein
MEAAGIIKEEKTPQISQLWINRPAEPGSKGRFNIPREPRLLEHRTQLLINLGRTMIVAADGDIASE